MLEDFFVTDEDCLSVGFVTSFQVTYISVHFEIQYARYVSK